MNIALYMRLSMADKAALIDDDKESNSIENQRELLLAFIESNDALKGNVVEYVDDGYSGTNFERPAFIRMIEDMKRGSIDVLLTKDLSRLGRDYVDVGDYMEQIFPTLGVRYIAVLSGYDSGDCNGITMGLDMSITNLVNALYSRDLSKKYLSAVTAKWKKGISTAGRVPLGYRKVPGSTSEREIVPEHAKIIRTIFQWAIDGVKVSEITHRLNENGIPSPGKIRNDEGICNYQSTMKDKEWLWRKHNVYDILHNYSYTGALVQQRRTRSKIGSRSARVVPVEDRYIVDDVFEAIVSKEEFEQAQKIIRSINRGKSKNSTKPYPIVEKVYCGNCNHKMAFKPAKGGYVVCQYNEDVGSARGCQSSGFGLKELDSIVRRALDKQLGLIEDMLPELNKKKAVAMKSCDSDKVVLEKKLSQLKSLRLHEYEQFSAGLMSREVYLTNKEKISSEIELLHKTLERLKASDKHIDEISDQINETMSNKPLLIEGPLSEAAVNAFIDSVFIYDMNNIEIRFAFEDTLAEAKGLVGGGK